MSPKYYKEVNEKRKILREIYGGMMTLKQLSRELGYSSTNSARKWVQEHALQGVRLGKSVRYETDQVARVIVDGRGMV
jgi:transposase-like protein